MKAENIHHIQAENGLGKLVCYYANSGTDIIKYVEEHESSIKEKIYEFGGVLFRNFNIRSVSEFSKLAQAVSPNLLDYVNRSTPRTKLGGKIYTATDYPAHRNIPFHNENSYTLKWPTMLLFFCVVAPQSGGETPIADSRQVFSKIDKSILKKFRAKKILYTRSYISGIDLSWQNVFQTLFTEEVEKYCDENNIQYTWHDPSFDGLELTTKQICQAVIKHPITSEDVWFNQAHLFHASSLDEADRNTLLSVINKDKLPRNAYYGDGAEIQVKDIKHILDVYDSEKIVFQWQKGDVLILDNLLMAHSRNPFFGERKIVVAMSDNHSTN